MFVFISVIDKKNEYLKIICVNDFKAAFLRFPRCVIELRQIVQMAMALAFDDYAI